MTTFSYPTNTPCVEKKIDGPCNVNFVDQAIDAASNLLNAFKSIAKSAERSIEREPYQIKLFWDTGIMQLRYDAFTWFDYVLSKDTTTSNFRADHASKYVNTCLSQKHDSDLRRRAMNSRDRYSPTQINEHTCHKHSCSCGKVHTPTQCTAEISCINGGIATCKQFFDTTTCIASIFIKNDQFMLHSRPESTRDILLFPVTHINNEKFVSTRNTWQAILEVEKRLRFILSKIRGTDVTESPIESVYFNYGSWTTAMTKNKLTKTAHAHVHLLLTPNIISTLSSDIRLDRYKPHYRLYVLNLAGCYRDPVDYEYIDAINLLNSRVLSYHIAKTEQHIGCINVDVRQMKDDLECLRKNAITKDSIEKLMKEMFVDFLHAFKNSQTPSDTLLNDMNRSSISTVASDDSESPPSAKTSTGTISSSQILSPNTSAPASGKLSKGQKKKAKEKRKKEKEALSMKKDSNQKKKT